MTRRTPEWTRSTCRSRCAGAATTGPRTAGWRPRLPAAWKRGAAGASSSAARPRTRWHRLCESAVRRWCMKLALTAVAVLLLAGPALAAPGDPRTVRGSLEWPASLSAEPFVVVRGDDGRLYYADVSSAQRMNAGAISGRISIVGVEGTQPHEFVVQTRQGEAVRVDVTKLSPWTRDEVRVGDQVKLRRLLECGAWPRSAW